MCRGIKIAGPGDTYSIYLYKMSISIEHSTAKRVREENARHSLRVVLALAVDD